MRTVWVVVALSSVAALAFAGCGGDSGTEGAGTAQTSSSSGSSAQKPLPADAPVTKVIAAQFPKPVPSEGAPPQAKKWIAAGEAACKGKTPTEVLNQFVSAAEAKTKFTTAQRKMLGEIAHYEKQATHSSDFAAGQLAAGVYERSLPQLQGLPGYQGCVYQLSLQLRRELAGK